MKNNKQKINFYDKIKKKDRQIKNKLKAIEYLGGQCAH